ncbi:MAG: divergent polysaccharide deacetylase family protein, partial [Ghiorsea sp.]
MPAWFKLLLAWLVALLLLLVWLSGVENDQQDASKAPAVQATPQVVVQPKLETHPKAKHVATKVLEDKVEDSIRQIIQPILEEGTITLTFEDELPEPTPTFKATKASTSAKDRPSSKHLALLIDDIGYDLRALQRLIALPYQINVAILPDAPHAKKAARMAHQHGITV